MLESTGTILDYFKAMFKFIVKHCCSIEHQALVEQNTDYSKPRLRNFAVEGHVPTVNVNVKLDCNQAAKVNKAVLQQRTGLGGKHGKFLTASFDFLCKEKCTICHLTGPDDSNDGAKDDERSCNNAQVFKFQTWDLCHSQPTQVPWGSSFQVQVRDEATSRKSRTHNAEKCKPEEIHLKANNVVLGRQRQTTHDSQPGPATCRSVAMPGAENTPTLAGPAEENPGSSSTSIITKPSTSMTATSTATNAGPAEENPGDLLSKNSSYHHQGNSTQAESTCDYEIIIDVNEEEERLLNRDLARRHKPANRLREKQTIHFTNASNIDDPQEEQRSGKSRTPKCQ